MFNKNKIDKVGCFEDKYVKKKKIFYYFFILFFIEIFKSQQQFRTLGLFNTVFFIFYTCNFKLE